VPLANGDLSDALHELSNAFGADRVAVAFDAVERAEQALQRNASPKIVADWLAVAL
jgi:hypothetical protein